MNILCFGEILFDVFEGDAHIGGAPFNFAAHIARLGGNAALVSAVGDDGLGARALALAKEYGVKTDFIAVLPQCETGKCTVHLNDGAPSYDLLQNVAYDAIPMPNAHDFDALYFGTLALRSAHNKKTLQTLLKAGDFKEIFVDVNLRTPFFDSESAHIAAQNATTLKISDEELDTFLSLLGLRAENDKDAAEKICDRFPNIRLLLLTLGAHGAIAYCPKTGNLARCEAQKTTVVSAVGAGDSFSAAFLMAREKGGSPEDALRFAAARAAFVVGHKEAIPDCESC